MKVIVFGGTGWLGHYIAMIFEQNGFDVTTVSRGLRQVKYEENTKNVLHITADKSDENQMREILSRQYDYIIDSVPNENSVRFISKYARNLKHYLHCSSTGGYTPLPFIPGNETMPYHGQAGAGWYTKYLADAMAMDLFHRTGFPATVIRPCYITGGGDKYPLDNLGGRRENFIPDLLHGKTLEVPNDGSALLQPIHIKDLASSFLNAVQHPRSIGQIYNICLDHAVTLNKYLEITANAIGAKLNIEYVPLEELLKRHPEDPVGLNFLSMHMCFSIDKAKRDIGYIPSHTPEETIEETAVKTLAKLRC